MRKLALLCTVAALGLGVAGYSGLYGADQPAATPAPKAEDQAMHRAHRNLLEAQLDLKNAAKEYAGHRAKAHQLAGEALKEVDGGLKLDPANDKLTDEQVAQAEKEYKKDDPTQGHVIMRSSLKRLTAAKENLTNAPHDYNGHRSGALKLVNQAIEEVNAGLATVTK